ncbi:uncharacterized protein AMSG_02760 [Thecamonas trahens ATCC 50062]|uniref:Transmembrane protein n=1 Tax=Thecamonas trahens ATCC 50062 TaxID=461836 RepID=A0A0L0D4S4_THETB|nr:hypothetical protein AMSG_02760 [Thecamonas trahens ATCC 50062]KNC46308.1 hypothetical protein AMSG_02760 [Thecamonas trahens ATCC 50062]|eukprot:XP_013760601.1 hypothetical protein AMSG_02760 [Thecamonas trahens ATCC 50062]
MSIGLERQPSTAVVASSSTATLSLSESEHSSHACLPGLDNTVLRLGESSSSSLSIDGGYKSKGMPPQYSTVSGSHGLGVKPTQLAVRSADGTESVVSALSHASSGGIGFAPTRSVVAVVPLDNVSETLDSDAIAAVQDGGSPLCNTAALIRSSTTERELEAVRLREEQLMLAKTRSDVYIILAIFISGFCCILPWLLGYLFLRSPNSRVRFLARLSLILFAFALIVCAIIIAAI